MSDEIAISVQNLTKIYKLYNSPQDRLKESLHPLRKKYHHDFYALNDVSFEIKKGETFGIIGKNGSGKSTLLKIITGVLTPSTGSVTVNGRVSALLELGAGFNPDLTGIENVYFNGTLMGYSKEEMNAKLDDILSFADIGEFVYQPMKTYSSGMFVRLAFASAISVNPEILIIDEALAVGDSAFQTKCLQIIHGMREAGVTVVFVSHDTPQVNKICNKAILLDRGKIKSEGDTEKVVEQYLMLNSKKTIADRMGTGVAKITDVELSNNANDKDIMCGSEVNLRIHYIANDKVINPVFTVGVYISEGLRISSINSSHDDIEIPYIFGEGFVDVKFPKLFLMPNVYFLSVGIWDSKVEVPYDWVVDAIKLTVKGKNIGLGSAFIPHEWHLNGNSMPVQTVNI